MAADLHDFVAHHVTGILVQTQMARMMAATEPDRLDRVLAGIEHAAAEALGSMRLTVGFVREGPQGTALVQLCVVRAGITRTRYHRGSQVEPVRMISHTLPFSGSALIEPAALERVSAASTSPSGKDMRDGCAVRGRAGHDRTGRGASVLPVTEPPVSG
ncbi:histidine kinase dimerization/phosphoacceptor domain-containing protein [Streptomyces mirabilis]|uniref:histidine kinase dimerization/phosphoacceptor domain-containing protein n=1 Tax=Streptomyces mirabilis TaxID=68239 RepID=UPI0033A89105